MGFRRLRPTESFFVNGTALCNLNQLEIHEQTVLSIHKRKVAGVVCADNRLTDKHRFGKTETEAFCAMQRDEAVAHLSKTICFLARDESINNQHPVLLRRRAKQNRVLVI